MSKFNRLTFRHGILIASLAGLFCPVALARTGDKLDGDWKTEVTATQGADKPIKDTLHFKKSKVSSDFFEKKGFKPVDYDTAEPRFGPTNFNATATNDAGAKIDWQGTALANSVEGTVTLTAKDGTKDMFSFKGTRAE